jgi:hypothetical protein
MLIERYELIVTPTRITLRGISPDTQKGYFVTDTVRNITGKSIDGLRKQGQKLAKANGVPFVEINN